MSVLRVLLGGLDPLQWLLDLNQSQMAWPRVATVIYSWIPGATGWPAVGESCHGVCKAGVPSPGDQASWGGKTKEKTQKKLLV